MQCIISTLFVAALPKRIKVRIVVYMMMSPLYVVSSLIFSEKPENVWRKLLKNAMFTYMRQYNPSPPRIDKKFRVSLQDRPARQRNLVFAPGITLPRHFPCRRRAPSLMTLMTLYEPFTTTAFVTGLVCLPARSLGGAAYYPVTVHRNTLFLYESTVVMVL